MSFCVFITEDYSFMKIHHIYYDISKIRMPEGELTRWCLLIIMIGLVKGSVIIVGPDSVITTLYTAVNFTCEGNGERLDWLVESIPLTNLTKQQRKITVINEGISGNLSSVLFITAVPSNDGISIACRVISFNPFKQVSSSSALTIRGITPAENIEWFADSKILSWSRPSFYSIDIPQGSFFTYNILLDGISVASTTDTSVWLLNVSSCIMEFNVSIVTSIYYYTAQIRKRIPNIANTSYFIEAVNFTFFNETEIEFSVTLTIIVSSTAQFCGQSITGSTINSDGVQIDYDSSGTIYTAENHAVVSYVMNELEPCNKYTGIIYLQSSVNEIEDMENMTLVTYNVQDVILSTEGNGSLSVQCVYEESSTADGCHVIFTDTINGRNESFNITANKALLVQLVNGHYTVTIYEIIGTTIKTSCIEPKQLAILIPVDPYSSTTTSHSTDRISVMSLTDVSSVFTLSTIATSTVFPTTQSESTILILSTVSSTVCVMFIVLILLIIVITSSIWKKKKHEVFIVENSAYGQVELQRPRPSRVRTEINPAYETVAAQNSGAVQLQMIYETVW